MQTWLRGHQKQWNKRPAPAAAAKNTAPWRRNLPRKDFDLAFMSFRQLTPPAPRTWHGYGQCAKKKRF